MKTHQGKITNHLVGDKIYSSNLVGDLYGGHTTMSLHSLNPNVEGKDLVFDVMLKELVNHKQDIKDGKDVTIHIEWDIKDDYSEYIACRVLSVEIKDNIEA